jgi:3-dehydroquinate dehydratase / shikimate dehydrogenase
MVDPITLGASVVGVSSHEAILEIPDAVTLLEVRGSLTEKLPVEWLRQRFSGELLYSLLNGSSDRRFACPLSTRHQILVQAGREYDLVEVDADSDLTPEVLSAIPAEKRLVCWKGPGGDLAYLHSVFERISSVPARMYSMIVKGSGIGDGAKSLQLLKDVGRRDLTAVCDGKAGFWSRILAPHFGAPLILGRLDHNPIDDSGEPSVHQLIEDYAFPALHPIRELCGIVGNRVFQSPSPRLHNAGYRAIHHPALFLPFHVDNFDDFWREIIAPSVLEPLGLPIKGLTIVSPYKEAAFAAAASRSHMACKAGASNIFLRRNDSWEAHTTDTESVASVAEKGPNSRGPIKAAVIGCGGAGRAIAAALQQAGAQVSLVNRGQERGDLAVRLLGLPFIALANFQPTGFSLLVNATPVGRDDNSIPFDIDTLSPDTLVIDLVYRARPTSLATGVAARGGTVIDGYDVLLNQVRKQFHMMTGWELPSTVGRQTAASQGLGSGISSRQELSDESLAVPLAKVTALRVDSAPPS